jgi:hypothetical protein
MDIPNDLGRKIVFKRVRQPYSEPHEKLFDQLIFIDGVHRATWDRCGFGDGYYLHTPEGKPIKRGPTYVQHNGQDANSLWSAKQLTLTFLRENLLPPVKKARGARLPLPKKSRIL